MNFWQKVAVGGTLDLVALALGFVAGGMVPLVGVMSGPVYAAVLLIIAEMLEIAMGA